MPRPEVEWITYTLDGREVQAPAGAMLVDAAKYGDVEIPVFCYEPKLGQPVGACRMCLVEIEGIPKLQTACSTPVRDGMVVNTQTDRVHQAQRAVVEFLLINHPLDCPVCDKGGECPLQDVTYGWGGGTSRFIEPKRHFKKPLELSPLIAIDRERCILCYRCVRFSQEIAEDYQLILQERGAHTYVSTFDGHPYVAPFTGNIIELCPVGALTGRSYRFRARPWDIEGAGTICTMCPSQCNVELTVRDEKVMRVLARDHSEVDDGWLCDKGRFAFQHVHTEERILQPMIREGGAGLLPVSWERALERAASALSKAGPRAAAVAGGETTNEEALMTARLFREALGSSAMSARPHGALGEAEAAALYDPGLQATVPDLEYATSILLLDCDPIDEAPIWDLRIRKGIRRHHVQLHVASARPTALDANAASVTRFAPGTGGALLVALDAALSGDAGNLGGAASAAGSNAQAVQALADALLGGGAGAGDVVIVYPERLVSGARGSAAARALLNLTARLGLHARDGAGLLEIPSSTNARGIREAGFGGLSADAMVAALAAGELSTVLLLNADPLRTHPDRAAWEAGLARAGTVIAVESVMTETVRRHADIILPGEAYAEKEGTLVHPDGRLQRLRPGIGRSGRMSGWQMLAEISKRAGLDQRVLAGPIASKYLFDAVPQYRGLTLDEIGGRGVRWPLRVPAGEPWAPVALDVPTAAPTGDAFRLGRFRPLWASKEVDASPGLAYLRPAQMVELSPVDAQRLGIADGEQVQVGTNGSRVAGRAMVRAAIPPGSVFVSEGIGDEPANLLTGAAVELHPTGVRAPEADAQTVIAVPAAGPGGEMPSNDPSYTQPPDGTGFSQSEDGAR
jgi:NADH-quinone oxidoreductase subunit G